MLNRLSHPGAQDIILYLSKIHSMWQGESGKKRNQAVRVGLGGWHLSKELMGKRMNCVLPGEECSGQRHDHMGGGNLPGTSVAGGVRGGASEERRLERGRWQAGR